MRDLVGWDCAGGEGADCVGVVLTTQIAWAGKYCMAGAACMLVNGKDRTGHDPADTQLNFACLRWSYKCGSAEQT
jgi:hypothetical protein